MFSYCCFKFIYYFTWLKSKDGGETTSSACFAKLILWFRPYGTIQLTLKLVRDLFIDLVETSWGFSIMHKQAADCLGMSDFSPSEDRMFLRQLLQFVAIAFVSLRAFFSTLKFDMHKVQHWSEIYTRLTVGQSVTMAVVQVLSDRMLIKASTEVEIILCAVLYSCSLMTGSCRGSSAPAVKHECK